jgi:hypothetical protein
MRFCNNFTCFDDDGDDDEQQQRGSRRRRASLPALNNRITRQNFIRLRCLQPASHLKIFG